MSSELIVETAIAYHQRGNYSEAEKLCKEALKQNPKETRAYRLLGIMAHQYSQHDLAKQLLEKAVELNPLDPAAYIELGIATKHGSELDARKAQSAINLFETAFKLDPSQAKPLTLIVAVLCEYGELDEALKIADLTVEVEPENAHSHISRANVLKLQGEIAAAITEYELAYQLNPKSGIALHNLINIIDHRDKTELAKRNIKLVKTLIKNQMSRSEETLLHFALAKIYDEIKDYPNAFKHLIIGNDLKRKSINFCINNTSEKADYLISTIKQAELSPAKPDLEAYAKYPRPIFILGMPRSGSSLIEQILASHSDVFGAGELFTLSQSLAITDDSVTATQDCINRISKLNSQELTQQGIKYLNTLNNKNNSNYVCDKLPANFWHVALIRHILPHAIIIHSERDAIDTCLSCYQQNFTSGHNYIYDLKDLASYYNAYARLMKHWQGLYPEHIYKLSYEALTENQELETRKLLEHCQLEWQDQCLDFHKTKRSVATASAVQVREPIYKHSVAKWQHYQEYLKPLLDTLEINT